MKYVDKVVFSREARNFLKKTTPQIKEQIKEGIEGLKTIPSTGDVKPLEGYKDRFRLRVGKYRVIFRYEGNDVIVLYIIDIGARGDIYK